MCTSHESITSYPAAACPLPLIGIMGSEVRSKERPRLLVLGAGPYQIPTLHAARSLGVETIALDRSPDAKGFGLSDYFHAIDTTDYEGVLSIADRYKIDGIIASCTDVPIANQAAVANKLGLPAPSLAAAKTLSDKGAFRDYQRRRSLFSPFYCVLSPGSVEQTNIDEGEYIVKPAAHRGARAYP